MLVHARTAGVTAAVAAALLLGGCGSGDGGDSGKDGGTESGAPAGGQGSQSGAEVGIDAVAGVWRASGVDGESYLSVSGRNVALVGKHSCAGKVTPGAGKAELELTCPDGNTERIAGTATPGTDGRTLKVEWGSGTSETYTKAGGGKLPEDLPTGIGIPSAP